MENKLSKNKSSGKKSKATVQRAGKIIAMLEKIYPGARCSLDFQNPLQLLIATILSAQCTDKRVNLVTPRLFKKYKTARALATADPAELMQMIRPTGFFRNKARNIIGCCRMLVKHFGGKVPGRMEDLIALPGVARKTANVVLYNAFGLNEGIVVDTHVKRLSRRLGFTKHDQPEKIEQDLMLLTPKNKWGRLSNLLIELGRDVCKAPKPKCKQCQLKSLCPWYAKYGGNPLNMAQD